MILPISFDFLESIAPKKSCKPYKKKIYLVFSPLFTFECIKNIYFFAEAKLKLKYTIPETYAFRLLYGTLWIRIVSPMQFS